MKESDLQIQVAEYLRLQYPEVLFKSDFGAGLKLSISQAVRQKRQNGGKRGFPDIFVYEPRGGFNGLGLELKRENTRLKKKDGTWATEHLKEQAEVLLALKKRGYEAQFAVGFDKAKKIIDNYLTR